jgi:hypothetical protein
MDARNQFALLTSDRRKSCHFFVPAVSLNFGIFYPGPIRDMCLGTKIHVQHFENPNDIKDTNDHHYQEVDGSKENNYRQPVPLFFLLQNDITITTTTKDDDPKVIKEETYQLGLSKQQYDALFEQTSIETEGKVCLSN